MRSSLRGRNVHGKSPAAILLTGGASRRMGQAKAALVLDNTTLGDRTARLLERVATPVIEVGPGYTTLAHVQESPAGAGPLAAVAAGWTALAPHRPPAVLVLATDMPRLTEDLLAWLAGHPGEDSVVPRDKQGKAQPLCARYSPAAMDLARDLVETGHRSMHGLLDRIAVTYADAPEPDDLLDVDTPEDLAREAQGND